MGLKDALTTLNKCEPAFEDLVNQILYFEKEVWNYF